jgi:hypothetical protein
MKQLFPTLERSYLWLGYLLLNVLCGAKSSIRKILELFGEVSTTMKIGNL